MAGLTKKTSAFDDENLSGRSQKLFLKLPKKKISLIMEIMKLILIRELLLTVRELQLTI
jgi:hypothetical protein